MIPTDLSDDLTQLLAGLRPKKSSATTAVSGINLATVIYGGRQLPSALTQTTPFCSVCKPFQKKRRRRLALKILAPLFVSPWAHQTPVANRILIPLATDRRTSTATKFTLVGWSLLSLGGARGCSSWWRSNLRPLFSFYSFTHDVSRLSSLSQLTLWSFCCSRL